MKEQILGAASYFHPPQTQEGEENVNEKIFGGLTLIEDQLQQLIDSLFSLPLISEATICEIMNSSNNLVLQYEALVKVINANNSLTNGQRTDLQSRSVVFKKKCELLRQTLQLQTGNAIRVIDNFDPKTGQPKLGSKKRHPNMKPPGFGKN